MLSNRCNRLIRSNFDLVKNKKNYCKENFGNEIHSNALTYSKHTVNSDFSKIVRDSEFSLKPEKSETGPIIMDYHGKMNKLMSDYSNLQAENDFLKKKNSEQKIKIQEFEAKIHSFNSDNNELKNESLERRSLEERIVSFIEERSAMILEIERLQNELKGEKEKNGELENKLDEEKERREELEQSFSEFQKEKFEEFNDLIGKTDHLESIKEVLEIEIESLKEKMRLKDEEFDKINQLNEQLNAEKNNTEVEKEKKNEIKKKLKILKNEFDSQTKILEEKYIKLEKEINISQKMSHEKIKAQEEEIRVLKNELDLLRMEKEEVENAKNDEIHNTNCVIDELNEEIEYYKENSGNLMIKLEAEKQQLEKEKEDLGKRNLELKEQMEIMGNQADEEVGIAVEGLKRLVKGLDNLDVQANGAVSWLDSYFDDSRINLPEELEEQVEQLKLPLGDEEGEAVQDVIEIGLSKIENLNQKFEKIKDLTTTACEIISEKISKYQEEVDECENVIDQLEDDISSLKEANDRQNEHIVDLECEKASKIEMNEKLHSQIFILETQLEKIENQKKHFELIYGKLSQSVKSKNEEIEKLKKDQKSMEENLYTQLQETQQDLSSQLLVIQNKNYELNNQIGEKETAVNDLEGLNAELRQQIAQLMEEIELIKKESGDILNKWDLERSKIFEENGRLEMVARDAKREIDSKNWKIDKLLMKFAIVCSELDRMFKYSKLEESQE